jgi:hypothetical protein
MRNNFFFSLFRTFIIIFLFTSFLICLGLFFLVYLINYKPFREANYLKRKYSVIKF